MKFRTANCTTSVMRTINEFCKVYRIEKVHVWEIEDVFYIEENQHEPECKRRFRFKNWNQVKRYMHDHRANYVNRVVYNPKTHELHILANAKQEALDFLGI